MSIQKKIKTPAEIALKKTRQDERRELREERLDEVFSGAGCLTGNHIAYLKRKAKEREEANRLSQGHSDQTD